jgi:DNA-binding response OmpR family regulator
LKSSSSNKKSLSGKAYIQTEFSVRDSGAGIPQEQLGRIFDRFYQVDNSLTREHEGTGIGLSLTRELVELHQGSISVSSEVGTGTQFTISLPLELVHPKQLDIAVGQHVISEGVHARDPIVSTIVSSVLPIEAELDVDPLTPLVLIVEDNNDLRRFLRQSLTEDTNFLCRVIEGANGQEGYELAMAQIPDLIISDIMMPRMDGVELCHRLKNDKRTDHIPIILLTAKASGESKIEGLETGADDYLTKPFEEYELLVRIKNLIEGRRKLRERFSREVTLQPASIPMTSMDEKLLQHVMKIMEAHMSDSNFGVEAFGREAGMSRTQLHRKLKALTDQSPGDFIRIMRLKRAGELLNNQVGSIAEVAFMVGFNDPSYFTKCFQKQFGRTPSEFILQNNFLSNK